MEHKLRNRVRRILPHRGLQTKMVAIFFVLLLLPSSIFTFYASGRIKAVVREQTFAAARKTFEETASALQTRVDKACSVLDLLIYEHLIYNMASTDPQDYPYILQWEDQRLLVSSFENLESLADVSGIRFYVKNDYLYSNENCYIFSMRKITGTGWYQKLLTSSAHQWFTPIDFQDDPTGNADCFSCMRMLYDPAAPLSPLAILRVDIAQSQLNSDIQHSAATENGTVLLLDNGRPVLSYSGLSAAPIPQGLSDSLQGIAPKQWVPITVRQIDYYAYSIRLDPAPWQLVTVIPVSDISSVSDHLQRELLLVMFLVASVSFGLAISLSNRLLRRIWQLTDTMQTVETGNVEVQLSNSSNDEIGQLITHFNHMMDRIHQLLDEKVAYGIEIKNLELKALQAQINPHFLYNTIDTINCLALQKNVPEISELASALATFYKISLSKGRDTISIHDEILNAKMYLLILNYRFHNQIHTIWEIDPAIETFGIIKIILQPIIENAVIHGIFEKEDSRGTILVRGLRRNNDIYITVTDDGVGMSQDIIRANFFVSSESGISDAAGGYGIRNIMDRLRIAYGAEYGLSCESTPQVGTTITIHIPAQAYTD